MYDKYRSHIMSFQCINSNKGLKILLFHLIALQSLTEVYHTHEYMSSICYFCWFGWFIQHCPTEYLWLLRSSIQGHLLGTWNAFVYFTHERTRHRLDKRESVTFLKSNMKRAEMYTYEERMKHTHIYIHA